MALVPPVDLDRSMPVLVRREAPSMPGPPASVARHIILVVAAAAAAGALLLMSTMGPAPAALPVITAYMALALAAGALWWAPPGWLMRGLASVMVAGALVIGFGALQLGWGLNAPAVSLLALMVCVLGAAAGWRAGALMASVATAVLLGLAWVSRGQPTPPGIRARRSPASRARWWVCSTRRRSTAVSGGTRPTCSSRSPRWRRACWASACRCWCSARTWCSARRRSRRSARTSAGSSSTC